MARPGWQILAHSTPIVDPPNYVACNRIYGEGLIAQECYQAADRLPHGANPRAYQVRGRDNPLPYYTIPFSIQQGGCYISVEIAGPTLLPAILLIPDRLRLKAAETIDACVNRQNGSGGFGTYGIANLFGYLLAVADSQSPVQLPSSTAFVTISVTGLRAKLISPGDRDNTVPFHLSNEFRKQANRLRDTEKDFSRASELRSASYRELGLAMLGRPMTSPWWSYTHLQTPGHLPSGTNEMSYECDAKLGTPAAADCSRIEWEALRPDSDTVRVGPGAATFLHRNACYVAITASVDLVLSWEQVRRALGALLSVCVLAPDGAVPQGGRAFHAAPPRRIRGRAENPQSGLSGLNALPPHANITLFQQREKWVSTTEELQSCTWKAVGKGAPVADCKTA